jgi:hypothetical protein
MGVFIFQPDALDKMAEVEGQRWKDLQIQMGERDCCFFLWLAAYKLSEQEKWHEIDVATHEILKKGHESTIYGAGGWTRYRVQSDGEIIFLQYFATTETSEKAAKIGFTVR